MCAHLLLCSCHWRVSVSCLFGVLFVLALLLLLSHMMRTRARTWYLYACVHGLYLLYAIHTPIGGYVHGVMLRSSLGIASSQTELVVIPEFDLADTAPWL